MRGSESLSFTSMPRAATVARRSSAIICSFMRGLMIARVAPRCKAPAPGSFFRKWTWLFGLSKPLPTGPPSPGVAEPLSTDALDDILEVLKG